ncbi:hypothetical protein DFH07DRAFT_965961 [Mycena maculata]|uniref:Uncharacterized protein n=1 Tax=Mycena maculata TaxID=230809 RepID=A0AAD7IAQ8_9AGAR|nr:hypothetical protein DFH07DRAFT_965961 [Mycena maculata]
MASSASTLVGANIDTHIMLSGIGFQFAIIVLFSDLTIDFMQQYVCDRPMHTDSSVHGILMPCLKLMLAVIVFTTTLLFIRWYTLSQS